MGGPVAYPRLILRSVVMLGVVAAVTIAATATLSSEGSGRVSLSAGRIERSYPSRPADSYGTSKGWSPVAFERVQISVPSQWVVVQGGQPDVDVGCDGRLIGVVAVFADQRYSPLPGPGCHKGPDNLVAVTSAPRSAVPHARGGVVNGIRVRLGWRKVGSKVTYIERALGMDLSARGPLARRVLSTLKRSPLSVVLRSRVVQSPRGWRSVTFGGLRFSVPASWGTRRDSWWGGCPYRIGRNVLRLSTARALASSVCLPTPSKAGYEAAIPGIVVGAGPQVRLFNRSYPAPMPRCLHRHALKICLFSPPLEYEDLPGRQLGLLTAEVFLPDRRDPDQVEIGLSGSGLLASRIFDSLRSSGT